MKRTNRNSWPVYLLQLSNFTFDTCFKGKWVLILKWPYISIYIGAWAWVRTSCGFSILLTTEVIRQIFPNLNVVAHLVVPVGWGLCLTRLAIFL